MVSYQTPVEHVRFRDRTHECFPTLDTARWTSFDNGFEPSVEGSAVRATLMIAGTVLIAAELVSAAFSQGSPQRIATVVADPRVLTIGYRTSRVVGNSVLDDAGEAVGRVDDLIVTPGGKMPYAVLSVGGFPGVETRIVVESATALDVTGKRLVLLGATRASLTKLPSFAYAY